MFGRIDDCSAVKVVVTTELAESGQSLEPQVYYLSKTLLMRSSEYFSDALNGLSQKSDIQEVHLKVHDIKAFEHFVLWLFSGRVNKPLHCGALFESMLSFGFRVFLLGSENTF